jgi:hypothetical protein
MQRSARRYVFPALDGRKLWRFRLSTLACVSGDSVAPLPPAAIPWTVSSTDCQEEE